MAEIPKWQYDEINQFRNIADIENLVVIAPAFDCILNWPLGKEGLLLVVSRRSLLLDSTGLHGDRVAILVFKDPLQRPLIDRARVGHGVQLPEEWNIEEDGGTRPIPNAIVRLS